MQSSFQWRCPTCGQHADADRGICPRCGAPAAPPTLAERWNQDHPGDPMLAAAPTRRRLRQAAGWSRSRPKGDARRRAWLPLAIVSSVAAVLVGLTLRAPGVFDSGATKSSSRASPPGESRTATRPRSSAQENKRRLRRPAPSADLGAHRVLAARAFSVAYPRGWTVQSAEASAPWGTDTTIIAPRDPQTMLRVDVTASPATGGPISTAKPVIASVAQQPGYRELGLSTGTFDGRPAARWEFLVAEAGVLLRKEDVFFTSPSGSGIAVLTSAPADAYRSLAKRFTAIRRSLVVR